MPVIAHIAGFPLEELLPSLAGSGAALLAARAWVFARRRRPAIGENRRRG